VLGQGYSPKKRRIESRLVADEIDVPIFFSQSVPSTLWRFTRDAGEFKERFMQQKYEPVLREALSIGEVCNATNLGRTKVYEAIAQGRLKARKYGKRTLVLMDDLRAFLSALPPST
jgi:excisionase family DNA binding protein